MVHGLGCRVYGAALTFGAVCFGLAVRSCGFFWGLKVLESLVVG